MVDNIRFFAGASRILEGQVLGEYMTDHTSTIRPRADRGLRPGRAVELPDDDGGLEVRPGTGAGQHRRAQALGHHSSEHPAAGGDRGGVPAAGVFNVICGDRDTAARWSSTRSRRWCRSPAASARHGRSRPRRPRTSKKVIWSWAARPQWSCSTTPTSRRPSRGIAAAGFFNAGQDCTAATRVLVQGRLAGDFTEALAEAAKGTKVGPPSDPDAFFGPVNNANQLARVKGFLDRTPSHASVVTGGEQLGDRVTSTPRPWSAA